MVSILDKTKDYAIKKHKSVNQKYDNHDYDYHLNMVFETAQKFIESVETNERENVLAACWVHDIIEDTRETYNGVKKVTNQTISDLAYALTNEKGRTRAERANDKYYKGIRETKNASFIKFCDRIANVTYSKNYGSSMFEQYKKEHETFVSKIFVSGCEEVSEHLNTILKN
ncbi:phosphohydrolase [Tamlana sedimentorum]|uniref:Phosphohydrolase n=1 Tax=Neotamlana sedimentorum TaxID=1435349 RepID=A0A0D7WBT7_9FLAO|nr:phosphohydrolase [Tamlana sedimentorum]KJD36529.1 phosphohydrolase [Tamlana sedimentorum]